MLLTCFLFPNLLLVLLSFEGSRVNRLSSCHATQWPTDRRFEKIRSAADPCSPSVQWAFLWKSQDELILCSQSRLTHCQETLCIVNEWYLSISVYKASCCWKNTIVMLYIVSELKAFDFLCVDTHWFLPVDYTLTHSQQKYLKYYLLVPFYCHQQCLSKLLKIETKPYVSQ